MQPTPEFPEILPPDYAPKLPGIRAAVILDEFSETAFAPEWTQIPLLPDGWREQLDSDRFDLLFVESAWRGSGGSWRYHFTGPSAPRPAVVELANECRRRGIPTIFWNKEDPPHFENFLASAALFDIVLTTDANCIPRYKERLGHDRVFQLAFAAQPRIHNPARPAGLRRERVVAFGGTYFRDKYPERRAQMDYLLPAAAELGLDIYSRHSGDEKYDFPGPLTEHVRGALTYPQMLAAYHAYKVLINVNSVVDSPTMCPRRVFEISACGGAVVSAPSEAIRKFFAEDVVIQVDNKDSAFHELRALVRSEEYRDRVVHLAQREIWEKHTYSHRVQEILGHIGIEARLHDNNVSVIAPTIRPANIDNILDSVSRQRNVEVELVILTHGFEGDPARIAKRAQRLGIGECRVIRADKTRPLGSCLNQLVRKTTGDVIAKMDDDDYYGDNYLRDLLHALRFSDAQVVGKAATYVHFAARDAMILTYPSREHQYSKFVRGATIMGHRSVFLDVPFEPVRAGSDSRFLSAVRSGGGRIYAADRFNYIVRRGLLEGHTWKITDRELFGKGDVKLYGDGRSHVRV